MILHSGGDGCSTRCRPLKGAGALIGQIYPTTHYLTIARGTFSKALDFSDLGMSFIPLLIAVPVLLGLCVALLKEQET